MEIAEKLEETAREFEGQIRPTVDEARKRVSALNDQAITYIKTNPGKCVLGAIALGYLFGRIARR